ncbi:hypothetical protein Ciccas_005893 [Cichlidogyrus casuarinus]|uniref:Uncharacterized protein n=1 Tax=Cichlidogyrus casuarinus TaxID=1844966 RepID=A0ABD2Q9R9_9PLAT
MATGPIVILLNITLCNLYKNLNSNWGFLNFVDGLLENNIPAWLTVLIILGYGLFSVIISLLCKYYTRVFYNEVETVDTAFTGGGQLSAGLIMTNLVSQWTWAATLLQSSGVGIQYGLSGPLWYASGACIQLIIFSTVSVMLKIRAPGAITFLQVIRARFGTVAHVVFCVFALLTNLIVSSMLMLGASTVLTQMTMGLSVELSALLLVLVIGISVATGNLACTYYISYFTSSALLVCIIAFTIRFFNIHHQEEHDPYKSFDAIYDMIFCRPTDPSNFNSSYFTILSTRGLMFGVVNIIGNFGTVFVDQSYWAASVAAKPSEGVIGFILGGIVWFAIPFTFGTVCSLFYLSIGTALGNDFLTQTQVDSGLAPIAIATFLFGSSGKAVVIAMVVIAVTTTASSEVYAVTSILIYDIYATYMKVSLDYLDC